MGSVANGTNVIPVQSTDRTDQQNGVVIGLEREPKLGGDMDMVNQVVVGFGNEGRLSFEGAGGFSSPRDVGSIFGVRELDSKSKFIIISIIFSTFI